MIVHPVEIVLLGNLKMYLDVTIVEVTDSKTPYTAISKKVVRKKFARGNPERYYGIWSIHFSRHCRCRTYFSCFPLALTTILPWPLVPFFQISLKNSEPQTTHNTFRVCRVHFSHILEIAVYTKPTRVSVSLCDSCTFHVLCKFNYNT